MEDYISQMVQIANALSLTGDKVTNKELALFIFGELSNEYDPIMNAITTRSRNDALTVDEIQGLLLNHEIILNKNAFSSFEIYRLTMYEAKGIILDLQIPFGLINFTHVCRIQQ